MKIKYDVYYTSPIEDEVFIDVDINKIVDYYLDLIQKSDLYKGYIEKFVLDYIKDYNLYGDEFDRRLTCADDYYRDEHGKCYMDDEDFNNLVKAIKNEITRRNNEN